MCHVDGVPWSVEEKAADYSAHCLSLAKIPSLAFRPCVIVDVNLDMNSIGWLGRRRKSIRNLSTCKSIEIKDLWSNGEMGQGVLEAATGKCGAHCGSRLRSVRLAVGELPPCVTVHPHYQNLTLCHLAAPFQKRPGVKGLIESHQTQ